MSGCIEQYVLLAKNASGAALQHLVSQALEDSSVFVFGELMSLPNITELRNSPEGLPYWNLLQLFAYETYNKYLAALAQNQVPALSENQIHKLRQLTIAKFATKLKHIPYKLLLDELGMANKRQLEDLIIEAMYANIVTGKLDHKNELLEVEACMGRDVKMEDLKANAKLLNDWLAQISQTIQTTTKMAAANPSVEKVQNLPLVCVETILKFTPTCKLARLHSKAAPLPGAFWSLGLETVLRKRLPLSLIRDDLLYPEAAVPPTIFDVTGAAVACIKHPETLRCSPLLEFVESAFLTVHEVVEKSTQVLQFYVCDGEALLSSLQNVTALSLVLCDEGKTGFMQKDLLAPNLKHLLPQLESFDINRSNDTGYTSRVDQALCDFLRALPMREMTRPRRLQLPVEGFRCAMEQSNSANCSAQSDLSGLISLGIWQGDQLSDAVRTDVLRFVSTRCRELTVLFVFVSGELKSYLDAFRALTCLKTLGMKVDLSTIQTNGLTYGGSEVIKSVSDLRIISAARSYVTGASIFKIAIFFPNVRAIALKDLVYMHELELATSLFGERQLFPAIAKLSCFFHAQTMWWSSEPLTPFLANPHLPVTVDLSHTVFQNLGRDADLLRAIYCVMQASSIKILLLRGPVHREALPHLQSHIALNDEIAKVSAWKDRDLGDQPGALFLKDISQLTDVQIFGLKTSGNLKGERFTIRVFHQLAKEADFFD